VQHPRQSLLLLFCRHTHLHYPHFHFSPVNKQCVPSSAQHLCHCSMNKGLNESKEQNPKVVVDLLNIKANANL
jgi:hypothetical protein